jgi:predicted phage terminase large subunit-like protein
MDFIEDYHFLIDTPCRYKVLYGGRGSGKSHQVARALIVMATQKPLRILCTRELQKSIKDSVLKLLADIIIDHNLEHLFQIQTTTIRCMNGSEFIFAGLRNNPTEIKSMEGVDIVWCEEAANITKESWDLLIPTIRKDNSEIWVTFNPRFETDATYQRFILNTPDNCILKKFNYTDNPFFNATLREEMELCKKLLYEDYLHIWEGELMSMGGKVIKRQYFNHYDEYPSKIKRLFVTADTAMKVKQHNDYSVFSVWGVTDTDLLWLDMVRGKWEAPELIEQAQKVYDKWTSFFEACILSGFYIEDKASGTGLIQTLKRNSRIPVIPVPRNTDKGERLQGVLDYIASGRVCLPSFNKQMSNDIINECTAIQRDFQQPTNDDIVDTLIDAVNIAEGRQQTTIPLSMYV